MPTSLLARAVRAHDPEGRFARARTLHAELRVGGNILAMRLRDPRPRSLRLTIDTMRPRVRLESRERPGRVGELDGDTVRIHDDARVVAERPDARRTARGRLVWDELDELYFLGYALWNYALTPFHFARPGYLVEELPEADGLQRLRVTHPPELPTHCRTQVFHFNAQDLLVRLDYTAEVFGPFWRGAHLCGAHRNLGGFVLPTHRHVHPTVGGVILPFPTAMEGWVDSLRADDAPWPQA